MVEADVLVFEIVADGSGGAPRLAADRPPDSVAFSPELIDLLRAGKSPWAVVVTEHTGAELVVMCLANGTLTYELTGEIDLSDGLVAVLRKEENDQ